MAKPIGPGLQWSVDWLNDLSKLIPQPIADAARVFAGVGSPQVSLTPHNVDTSNIPSYAMGRGIPSTVYDTQVSVPPTTKEDVLMAGMTPPMLMGVGGAEANVAGAALRDAESPLLQGVKSIFKDVNPADWLEGFKNLKEFREAHPERVLNHGTTVAYDVGDPAKVSKGGLVGPAHYTSNKTLATDTYAFGSTGDGDLNDYVRKIAEAQRQADYYGSEAASIRADFGPEDLAAAQSELAQLDREAASHAADVQRLQKEMGDKAEYWDLHPNTRVAITPPQDFSPKPNDPAGFHLFDFQQQAPTEDLALLDKVIAEMRGQPSMYPMAEWGVGGNNAVLHEELTNILNGQNRANEALAKAGYDGIRHVGGRTVGLFDALGKPVEHDVTAVFPESLLKIRNALSGTPGGQSNAGYAAGLGGGAGLLGLLQHFFGQGQGQQSGQGSW